MEETSLFRTNGDTILNVPTDTTSNENACGLGRTRDATGKDVFFRPGLFFNIAYDTTTMGTAGNDVGLNGALRTVGLVGDAYQAGTILAATHRALDLQLFDARPH